MLSRAEFQQGLIWHSALGAETRDLLGNGALSQIQTTCDGSFEVSVESGAACARSPVMAEKHMNLRAFLG